MRRPTMLDLKTLPWRARRSVRNANGFLRNASVSPTSGRPRLPGGRGAGALTASQVRRAGRARQRGDGDVVVVDGLQVPVAHVEERDQRVREVARLGQSDGEV